MRGVDGPDIEVGAAPVASMSTSEGHLCASQGAAILPEQASEALGGSLSKMWSIDELALKVGAAREERLRDENIWLVGW